MTDTEETLLPRVVVTGAEGNIAAVIRQRLRVKGCSVTAIDRGDDVIGAIRDADVVVVLDAARPNASPADYKLAMRAVAQGLLRSSAGHLVAVIHMPPSEATMAEFADQAADVEREVRTTGVSVTSIRCGLVVGTSKFEGPSDKFLLAKRSSLLVPGDGTQCVRPIRLDDLADITVAAVTGGDNLPSEEVIAEGPETLSVDHLACTLNGGQTKLRHFPPVALSVLVVIFPPAALIARRADHIPADDWLLAPDKAVQTHVGSVELKSVDTAFPGATGQERSTWAQSVRAYRGTPNSGLIAFTLGGIGAAATIVGGHDVLSTSTIGGRLPGFSVAAAGLFIAVCGLILAWNAWAGRYALAFLAASLASFLILLLLVAGMVNGDAPEWATWLLAYLLMVTMMATVSLRRDGGKLVAVFLKGRTLKAVTAVVGLSTTAAVVQFVYSTVYVPATTTPTLSASMSIGRRADSQHTVLVADVKLRNATAHPVNLLASFYRADTAHVGPVRPPDANRPLGVSATTRWEQRLEDGALLRQLVDGARVRQDVVERGMRPIDQGFLFPAGTFLGPGEELQKRIVVIAPKDYELAVIRFHGVVARRRFEDTIAYQPIVGTSNGHRWLVVQGEIDDPSLLHQLTRTTRYIHTVADLGRGPLRGCAGTPVAVYIDNEAGADVDGPGCSDTAFRMARHYGLAGLETSAEVWLHRK